MSWKRDEYRHGDFNRICDQSGFKVKASETVEQWDGLIVRHKDHDPRHPQDFVRGKRDLQAVSKPRPEMTDSFLSPGDVTETDL